MAIIDNATLSVSTGHFYLAAVGTASPDDLASLESGKWAELGHTSIENIFTFSSEGGEVTNLGTLQAKTLRSSTSPRTDSFALTAMQFDAATLMLHFGANAALRGDSGKTQWLDIPDSPMPTTKAFLAVFMDGKQLFGVHAQKAEITRGDNLELPNTSSLVGVPLKVTPVNHAGAPSRWSITPLKAAAAPVPAG